MTSEAYIRPDDERQLEVVLKFCHEHLRPWQYRVDGYRKVYFTTSGMRQQALSYLQAWKRATTRPGVSTDRTPENGRFLRRRPRNYK